MKLKLSFWQIINMNVGFGIQYSFGFNKALLTRFMIFLAPVQTSCLYLILPGH
jgi:maltose/moltooligosaccharide transporter